MATLGDDCYFFCISACAKGPACTFRHVEAAKTCKIICQHWQMGGCFRPMCKFRHSDFKLNVDTSDVPCFWDTQSTGCTKLTCAYKHTKPRPQTDIAAITSGSGDSSAPSLLLDGSLPTDNTSTSSSLSTTSQNLTGPLVKPVIIQPGESEESNSSPVKHTPGVLQTDSKYEFNKQAGKIIEMEDKIDSKETKMIEKTNEDMARTSYTPKKTGKKIVKKEKTIRKAKVVKPKGENVKNAAAAKNEKVGKGKVQTKKKLTEQQHKSVKERLGLPPSQKLTDSKPLDTKKNSREPGSDSDDSIENIKVLSMEEIFRQKALESMMRKRAAEGKVSFPADQQGKSTSKTAPAKQIEPVKAPTESSSSSSSTEEEKSSDEEEQAQNSSEQSSDSSSSSSSSTTSSSSSSESDSEEYEPDVRRVIVDEESEKAARKRAKASLLKKQKANSASSVRGRKVAKVKTKLMDPKTSSALSGADRKDKGLKRRQVNMDYDSDDIVSARVTQPLVLKMKDRLGKPVTKTRGNLGLQSKSEKLRMFSGKSKRALSAEKDSPRKAVFKSSQNSASEEEEEEEDNLAGVKIKTLEEIRQEKIKKMEMQNLTTVSLQASPLKHRLGISPHLPRHKGERDAPKGRQVLLVNDSGSKSDDASNAKPSEEQKKVKRRPWRVQKRNVDLSVGDTDQNCDERTATEILLPDHRHELSVDEEDDIVNESPFERLRRRALMKKLNMSGTPRPRKMPFLGDADLNVEKPASPKRNIISDLKMEEPETKGTENERTNDDSSDSKKHKHKHKHKHHKRSKTERQIYMPPAMKNSASGPKFSMRTPLSPDKSPQKQEPIPTSTAKEASQKRGPHPIAAAWAAGLSLSAKGTPLRKPEGGESTVFLRENLGIKEKLGISNRLGLRESTTKPKVMITSIQTSQPQFSEPAGVTIKSFAEIMAEKRKRRQEMQAQKSRTDIATALPATLHPSLLASTKPLQISPNQTIPAKMVDAKPRMPISPIVFSSDNSSSDGSKTSGESAAIIFHRSQQGLPATKPAFTFIHQSPTSLSSSLTTLTGPQVNEAKSLSQTVKLKSGHKLSSGEKAKKVKLFKKKKSLEQVEDNNTVNSEDGNISSFSFHSFGAASVPSAPSASATSFMSDISQNPAFTHWSEPPSDNQTKSRYQFSSESMDSVDSLTASTLTHIPAFDRNQPTALSHGVMPQLSSTTFTNTTSHRSSELPIVDSEPVQKKPCLSVEDDFNFLEEDGLVVIDDDISGDVEPIDDLLQDIDELLA